MATQIFIAMVRQFHDGMQARVQNDGEFSEPFEVTNGVKQGCVIPRLFSMMFSAMLMVLFRTVILVFQPGTALMVSFAFGNFRVTFISRIFYF